MELEELKGIWTSLDNRMQQQEVLKTTLIKEMLISKSDKALSRLINYSYFGIILCLALLPLMIWGWTFPINFLAKILLTLVIPFIVLGLIIGIIQLVKLNKIDFTKFVNQNIYLVQKVNIFNKRYLFASYSIGFVLFILSLIIALINSSHIEPWRWGVFCAIIPIGIIGAFWEYKRMYRRNFNSILKSLEELKELEETE